MRLTCERQNSAAFTDNSATRIPDALNKKSAEFLNRPFEDTQNIPIVHNTITHNTFQLHTIHNSQYNNTLIVPSNYHFMIFAPINQKK
jgi:hypothetical protein